MSWIFVSDLLKRRAFATDLIAGKKMCKPFNERNVYTNQYAALSDNSKGRVHPLDGDGYRTEYQRDVHRIIYSQPFRRLRHKTQVFFLPRNDHICTRLEHALHVSSAARTVARLLNLNEDLAEAIGLGHDLGHAPFGHHGEKVLDDIAKKEGLSVSFQHEIHSLRVVDRLAALDREPTPGLNLTYEVRNGIISHNGEEFKKDRVINMGEAVLLEDITDRRQAPHPCTLEGCIVRLVDKITYAGRDFEDAIVAKLVRPEDVPTNVLETLGRNNGEIVGNLLEGLIDFSKEAGDSIGLSEELHSALVELIDFNYKNIYLHETVEKFKKQATRAIEELYYRIVDDLKKTELLTSDRKSLPDASVYDVLSEHIKFTNYETLIPELIALDFISGMTDNYVVACLDEIFVPKGVV